MGCSFENVRKRERDRRGKEAMTRTLASAWRCNYLSVVSSSRNSLAAAVPSWRDGENLSTTSLEPALDLQTFELHIQGFCSFVLMIYSRWAERYFLESDLKPTPVTFKSWINLSCKFSCHINSPQRCSGANRNSNLLEDENAAVVEMTKSGNSAHFAAKRFFEISFYPVFQHSVR